MREALIITLLEAGDAKAARAACAAGLERAPGSTVLLGLMVVVLDHLGEREAATGLVDLDRLVWTTWLDVPEGYRDIAEFNADLRSHDAENLYIAGSSVFPTSGIANPTLTIVALTLRLADHLRERLDG